MKRTELSPMPNYFDRYINLADDVEVMEALNISLKELETAPVDKWKELGSRVYAPGKWTVNDLLQHLIDTERVFTYRALSFARGDEQRMLGFDEDLFARNAQTGNRTIDDLLEESLLVRKSSIAFFNSVSESVLNTVGKTYNSELSVAAVAFILAGHQRWHFKVLEERYFPLLIQ